MCLIVLNQSSNRHCCIIITRMKGEQQEQKEDSMTKHLQRSKKPPIQAEEFSQQIQVGFSSEDQTSSSRR